MITYGILNLVNHKKKSYKKLMKCNRDSSQFNNKRIIKLMRIINQAKNIYYPQFKNIEGRKTFQTVDDLHHRKAQKSIPCSDTLNTKPKHKRYTFVSLSLSP